MTIVPNDTTRPWNPLPVGDLVTLMRGAGFFWCLAGGHAIERVVGRSYRAHEDIDIVVLRPEQSSLQQWLADWYLAAADPPGMLRPWESGERLPWRVHDVWGRRLEAQAWELQVMIQEADADSWYFRRDDRVHGSLGDLAVLVDGVPCLRMELQLLYKAKSAREKDEADFEQLLPLLDESQRRTLMEWLRLTCPNGHHWIPALEGWGV
jgi:hypothetical protein